MRIAILVICLFPLAGCATIMEGSGQSVTVATNPAGALCNIDRAGAHLGNDLTVSCTKDGYQPASVNQSPKFVGTTFGNILIGGLVGVVVDAATGSNFEYPAEVRLDLAPLAPAPAASAAFAPVMPTAASLPTPAAGNKETRM